MASVSGEHPGAARPVDVVRLRLVPLGEVVGIDECVIEALGKLFHFVEDQADRACIVLVVISPQLVKRVHDHHVGLEVSDGLDMECEVLE